MRGILYNGVLTRMVFSQKYGVTVPVSVWMRSFNETSWLIPDIDERKRIGPALNDESRYVKSVFTL